MDRYLVVSPHSVEECRTAVEHFSKYNVGFRPHFAWSCYDRDHQAYAFFEADNLEQALLAVPPLLRKKAWAIKMTNFKAGEISEDLPTHHSVPSTNPFRRKIFVSGASLQCVSVSPPEIDQFPGK